MRSRIRRVITRLSSSLWFIPALLTVLAVLLAGTLLRLDMDVNIAERGEESLLLISSADGANRLLGTIAGSTISVAGVLFSITILVLSTASQQFGPRLLGNFMSHRGTQFVLGTFVGVFTYSLIVLRFVGTGQDFVPHIATNVGLVLGLLSFFLLIYFVHHVATFIQAANVIDDVAMRMEGALRRFFPADEADEAPDDERQSRRVREIEESGASIDVVESGYIQLVDDAKLTSMARERDVIILLHHRPGQYLMTGGRLATIAPAGKADDTLVKCIHDCIVVGIDRSLDQDPEFSVYQLVEVALRALSKGVNDPFTAINCIDRLGSALAVVATRELPSRYRQDDEGRLRLVLNPLTYAGVVDAAFNQVRQAATDSPAVLFRMLEIIAELAQLQLPPAFRDALRRQFAAIKEENQKGFSSAADQRDYRDRCQAAEAALAKSSG